MTVLKNTMLSLVDWAKRLDPDGSTATVVELLNQANPAFDSLMFKEGNLPTGNRTTVRTGLPAVYWRMINQAIPSSKSLTAQVDDQAGMLEARSNIDVDECTLNGNTNEYRLQESSAFLESMAQEYISTMFYGAASSPEEFVGLSPRYSSLSAVNAQNIINVGGTGTADNTSIWLCGYGERTFHNIFPKGSKAGIDHKDLGEQTVYDASGYQMQAYSSLFKCKGGIVLKDWRYVVRMANITVGSTGIASTVDIIAAMIKATHRIPNLESCSPVFYMNRTAFEALDLERLATAGAAGLTLENVDGKTVLSFRGIKICKADALLNTEAKVA